VIFEISTSPNPSAKTFFMIDHGLFCNKVIPPQRKVFERGLEKTFSKKFSPKKEKYHPCPFAAVSPKG
jgi:hypothetical protein